MQKLLRACKAVVLNSPCALDHGGPQGSSPGHEEVVAVGALAPIQSTWGQQLTLCGLYWSCYWHVPYATAAAPQWGMKQASSWSGRAWARAVMINDTAREWLGLCQPSLALLHLIPMSTRADGPGCCSSPFLPAPTPAMPRTSGD